MEWFFWSLAIGVLAATDPTTPPLIDLCVWKYFGYESCPGCGLGHALAYLLNGDFLSAIDAHPLSPFAAGVILLRIRTLWPRTENAHPKEPNAERTSQ